MFGIQKLLPSFYVFKKNYCDNLVSPVLNFMVLMF